jgi:hypothetical protein
LAGGIVSTFVVGLAATPIVGHVYVIDKYVPVALRNTQYAFRSFVVFGTGIVTAENAAFVM